MKTTTHPVQTMLASPETFYLPKTGLYAIHFQTLPTTDELAAYARFRAINAQEAMKAIKGQTATARAQMEHHERMVERWKALAMSTSPRIDSMREKQSQGEPMKVYF